ncbi:MAG: nucleotidyltransferase domain-containing protein [Acidobacteria bacterium]|nr:nucleotidyltransferase domain-containing protein [Acidobacteriota bacterium]
MARKHGILLAVQFGSSISGRMHAASDIDIAVQLERAPDSLQTEAELMADVQALEPDRDLDLVVINRADPLLLKKITDECRLLYGSERRLYELRIYAFKRYQDHRRFLDMERDYVARTIASLTR